MSLSSSAYRRSILPKTLGGACLVLLGTASLSTAPLFAAGSMRTNVRLAPGDVWCPTGVTFNEGRADFLSSDAAAPGRGAFETAFQSPTNGWVYVTLDTDSDIHIDNILAMPRGEFFDADPSLFDSTACHTDANPTYPSVRLHAFDLTLDTDPTRNGIQPFIPWGGRLELFDRTSLDGLKKEGWQLGGATLDASTSAMEALASGDQAGVTFECVGSTDTVRCPFGSRSLRLPAGTKLRFPWRLQPNVDYLLQMWMKGPEGARVSVRIDDFSSCPDEDNGLFLEHTSDLEVEILDAELKPGIDPEIFAVVALIEDQSDTFGKLIIDGETHRIPQIDHNDRPKWDGTARFVASDLADPSSVSIRLQMWDNDEFDNAHVDIDADPTDRDLDLTVDLCRMRVEGDLSQDMQGVIEARGDAGSGDDQGIVRFTVKTPTGRPLSTDDLAVTDVDFVQVVHRTRYAVTERPGVVMVTLANNFSVDIVTEVRIDVYGPGGSLRADRFPVELPADGTKTYYFYADTPIYPPAPTPGVESHLGINVQVDPDGIYSGGLEPGDCRIDNDVVNEKMWKLVELHNLEVTWCKVARSLEVGDLVDDAKFNDVKDLGTSYMRAVFPTPSVSARSCPVPIPYTPNLFAIDFISSVLDAFEIPMSSVMPFAMVWDMNTFATLAGVDKMLGVLPYSGWYEQFDGWESVIGNSLGEAAPHAAIVLPEVEIRKPYPDPSEFHVKVTLPAHELAHTYGLSADSRLKDAATCGVTILGDPFGIGDLLCGATGGLDEYKSPDPARAMGNPATGFWVRQGIEDPRLAPYAGLPQCDRHCFMGAASPKQLDDWQENGRWIDVGDYELLIDRMRRHPDPEIIYLSGMIAPDDSVHLGPWFRLPAGIPDRVDGDTGGYRARFYDAEGELLQDVGIPSVFGASETDHTPPITFFGLTAIWPENTHHIDIDRSPHSKDVPAATLATVKVSESAPFVELHDPASGPEVPEEGTVDLSWTTYDGDGDPLSAVVLASRDGDSWSVVQNFLEPKMNKASIPVEIFENEGTYLLKVLVTDGIHSGQSEPVEVYSQGR